MKNVWFEKLSIVVGLLWCGYALGERGQEV